MAEGGWQAVRLGDVCTKIGSGATPRGGKDVYLEDGPYSLIRSQNIYNSGFRHNGLAFIGEQHAEQLGHVEVLLQDVLLNITGDSVARVCQVDPSILPARVNQHVAILRPDPRILSPRFLRYWLAIPTTQALLLSWAGSGGTRKALTKQMLESLEVLVPPLAVQQEIADVLGTLEDKIEMNRGANEALEEMVHVLFKSWFVDFDPVRAKVEGRWRPGESLPGLPVGLYSLFPERFVDSKLGQIPEGWDVGALGDTIKLFSGGTPRTSVSGYWGGDISWYTAKDSPTEGIFVLSTERTITREGVSNSPAQILPAGTTVISARGTVGRLGCLGRKMAMNQTCYGIRGAAGYSSYFTYWKVRMLVDQLRARTHGTIFDTITRQTFELVETVVVPANVAGYFEAMIEPMMERILGNLCSSRALASLQDAIAPKLFSREIRVGST